LCTGAVKASPDAQQRLVEIERKQNLIREN
jgi:hypothetical protein